MHSKSLLVLATTLLAASAVSQVNTLPSGYENMGGGRGNGTGVPYPFDRGNFRYQEVHSSWRNVSLRLLRQMQFRRAWRYNADTRAVKRTADITVNCAYADINKFNSTFSTNLLAPSGGQVPTTTFTKKKFNMPDWTKLTGNQPDSWSVILPFGKPFTYQGARGDFLWEIFYTNPSVSSPSGYQADRTASWGNNTATPRRSDTVSYGQGCTIGGRAMSASLVLNNAGANGTPGMTGALTCTSAPANRAVLAAVGIQRLNVNVGWCAPVQVAPVQIIPMGTSGATGSANLSQNITYDKNLIYVPIIAQCVSSDANGAIALSQATSAFMAPDPGVHIFKYLYTQNPSTDVTGRGPFTAGSVITGWR